MHTKHKQTISHAEIVCTRGLWKYLVYEKLFVYFGATSQYLVWGPLILHVRRWILARGMFKMCGFSTKLLLKPMTQERFKMQITRLKIFICDDVIRYRVMLGCRRAEKGLLAPWLSPWHSLRPTSELRGFLIQGDWFILSNRRALRTMHMVPTERKPGKKFPYPINLVKSELANGLQRNIHPRSADWPPIKSTRKWKWKQKRPELSVGPIQGSQRANNCQSNIP